TCLRVRRFLFPDSEQFLRCRASRAQGPVTLLTLLLDDVAEVVEVGAIGGRVAADDTRRIERQLTVDVIDDAAALLAGIVVGHRRILDTGGAVVVDATSLGGGGVAADDAGGVERQRTVHVVEYAAALETGGVAGDAGVLDERVAVVIVDAAPLGGGGVA